MVLREAEKEDLRLRKFDTALRWATRQQFGFHRLDPIWRRQGHAVSEEANFPVSRAHLEITIANLLQLREPNMGRSDSKEHLATQLDILSSSIDHSRHLQRPQHIRQQQAHSGVVQIWFPSHIRRSEDLKLGRKKG
jgi:hypothetical protein